MTTQKTTAQESRVEPPVGPPPTGAATPAHGVDEAHEDELEGYGGGHIQARHGRVDTWLFVVYVVLLAWALYYGFMFWGGLGPGLDLTQ